MSKIINVTLENTHASSTIWQATLSFDGRVIDSQPAAGGPVMAVSLGAGVNMQRGQHTLSVTIVRQTASPITYRVFGHVCTEEGRFMQLGDLKGKLATGQSLTWTFTF